MKTIVCSADTVGEHCNPGRFRQRWPMYEHVKRVTPSGRVYSSITGVDRKDGCYYVHTVELRDGVAIRGLT
jgi:hypothetical protein